MSTLIVAMIYAAAAPNVTLEDPNAAIRQDLSEGETEAALERLGVKDGVLPALLVTPGLTGRALEAHGERDIACSVYARDKKEHPERQGAASLHLARCLKNGPRAVKGYEEAARVLGELPRVLDEVTARLVALGEEELAHKIARAHLEDALDPKDNDDRLAIARVFLMLAKSGDKRAHGRLFKELGETPAAKEARALPSFPKQLAKDRAALMERARNLTVMHDNPGVFETLSRITPKRADKSAQACEVRYLLGKAARKTRRYKTARKHLDFVAQKCGGDPERKARYLAAQVAYFSKAKDAVDLFKTFLKKYPEDSLSDDVSIFLGERYFKDGDLKKSEAAYRHVVDKLRSGDMADHAHFQVAWLRALQLDTQGARAALDELARAVSSRSPLSAKDVVTQDRAHYWRARLLAFPNPKNLEPTTDKAAKAEGLKALSALALARPASFYGHQARLLVQEATGSVPAVRLVQRSSLDRRSSAPVSKDLDKMSHWRRARTLEAAGYDELATRFLDEIDVKSLKGEDQVAVALLYGRLGGLHRAHQVMRFSGHARLSGRPSQSELLLWDLAFPRAHRAPLFAAADEFGVPRLLLMGLSREESAFDASVVSWAGATGLCQLMPFTAREEAEQLGHRKLGISGAPTQEDLRQPALNARLGARHLSRRFKLGHRLLAIGAYNAGPGNIRKWRKGWPKGAALDGWIESIPVAQTRNYIKKVTGSWVIYSALDTSLGDVSYSLLLP